MRVASASDAALYAALRLPILVLIAFAIWVMASGVGGLERITNGTEFFVSNKATSNMLEPAGGATYEDQLIAAMDTQDPEQAQAALDKIEAQQQALANDRLHIS